jgi:hypothetical protein
LVGKSDRDVFEFLNELSNFKQLMPDNIDKFKVQDQDTFLFALRGMPEIELTRKEALPNSRIVLGSANDKLPFTLTVFINGASAHQSEVTLSFEGQFNAMMAMMVKTPITNFINTLSANLDKV